MEETLQWIAFVVFAIMTIAPAIRLVTSHNLFHSALNLLVSLFGVAGIMVLLVAPFLAAIQVLVYMGAIGILIIFAVMLTRGMMRIDEIFNSQWQAAAATAGLLFLSLTLILTPLAEEIGIDGLADMDAEITSNDDPADVNYETVAAIGNVIADRDGFVLPFEVASLLLTAAMIGAIVVAREDEA